MEQDNSSRTATDIILIIEAKIDQLIGFHMTQDLSAKIMSNKLNGLATKLDNLIELLSEPEGNSPLQIASALPSFPQSEDEHQFSIALETQPLGFPRTSRPETYATEAQMKNIVPSKRPPLEMQVFNDPSFNERKAISQRVVDRNGKA